MAQHCGYLKFIEAEGDNPAYYQGALDLELVSGSCYLVPREKRSPQSPDWTLKVQRNAGMIEFGVAWTKDMKTGGTMLSITIDAPSLQAPIYVAAFPRDQQPGDGVTMYDIQWSRPKYGTPPVNQVKERAEAGGVPF